MDELKMQNEVAVGARAQAAMDDPAIAEAFDKLEKAYFEAWRRSPADQTVERERLHMACTIIGKVREELRAAINAGKVARATLEQVPPGS